MQKKIIVNFLFFLFFLPCLIFFPGDAKAYLDPGTASFVVQIIIAAFATAMINIKMFWKKIKEIFSRRSEKQDGIQK